MTVPAISRRGAGARDTPCRSSSGCFDHFLKGEDNGMADVPPVRLEVRGAENVLLFVGVRKLRKGAEVRFEGSYGFNRDLVAREGTARRPAWQVGRRPLAGDHPRSPAISCDRSEAQT